MVLDWRRSGRVGSRRDPKTERPLTRTFCFSIPDNDLRFRSRAGLRTALDLRHDEAERPLCGMKRGGGTVSKGVLGSRFSGNAERRLRTGRRVGSRRDPTKQKTMHRMVFCFVCTLAFTYSPVP